MCGADSRLGKGQAPQSRWAESRKQIRQEKRTGVAPQEGAQLICGMPAKKLALTVLNEIDHKGTVYTMILETSILVC